MRVADYIADYVYRQGVKDVFMVSGGGLMFLTDGIACHSKLHAVCNHHEQASAMAAVSYAKYTGGLGVAYLTTGCGGTNAVTGVLDAWQDNVPCLFISGQCKRKETVRNSGLPLRQFGVQEADIISIVQSITKYAVMVNEPHDIAYHLDKAVYLAKNGRPGPVWLDIPMDVQGAVIDMAALRRFSESEIVSDFKTDLSNEEFEVLAKLLSESRRPVIIAGQGIRLSGAIPAFRKFLKKHPVPVVASRLGIDLLPGAHPLFTGRIGNKGDRAGNFAVQNSDLVLAVGSRLSVSSTGHEYASFARAAKIVVIDIDAVEHRKKTVRIDRFVNADAKRFFERMDAIPPLQLKDWIGKCKYWKAKWPVCLPEFARSRKAINLYYFTDRLSGKLKDDSVVVSDAGSAFYVVSQGIQLKKKQRYITSGAQAEMGYTLPACVGISIAGKRREVIGVTGDGSFQMNIQELQTMIHHKLPVKLFVWNNSGYLSIRATQEKFFKGRFIGTHRESGVSFPSLKKVATAYGVTYFKVSDSRKLDEVLEKVMKEDGVVLCEVTCFPDQEIIPTVSSARQSDGSMLSKPLEDMYPFLNRKEFAEEMIIDPLAGC